MIFCKIRIVKSHFRVIELHPCTSVLSHYSLRPASRSCRRKRSRRGIALRRVHSRFFLTLSFRFRTRKHPRSTHRLHLILHSIPFLPCACSIKTATQDATTWTKPCFAGYAWQWQMTTQLLAPTPRRPRTLNSATRAGMTTRKMCGGATGCHAVQRCGCRQPSADDWCVWLRHRHRHSRHQHQAQHHPCLSWRMPFGWCGHCPSSTRTRHGFDVAHAWQLYVARRHHHLHCHRWHLHRYVHPHCRHGDLGRWRHPHLPRPHHPRLVQRQRKRKPKKAHRTDLMAPKHHQQRRRQRQQHHHLRRCCRLSRHSPRSQSHARFDPPRRLWWLSRCDHHRWRWCWCWCWCWCVCRCVSCCGVCALPCTSNAAPPLLETVAQHRPWQLPVLAAVRSPTELPWRTACG